MLEFSEYHYLKALHSIKTISNSFLENLAKYRILSSNKPRKISQKIKWLKNKNPLLMLFTVNIFQHYWLLEF